MPEKSSPFLGSWAKKINIIKNIDISTWEKKITVIKRVTIFSALLLFALNLATKFPLILKIVYAASHGNMSEAIGYLKELPPEIISTIGGFIHGTLKSSWDLAKKTTYAFLVIGLVAAAIHRLRPHGKIYLTIRQCLGDVEEKDHPAEMSVAQLQYWAQRELRVFKYMSYFEQVRHRKKDLFATHATTGKKLILTHGSENLDSYCQAIKNFPLGTTFKLTDSNVANASGV